MIKFYVRGVILDKISKDNYKFLEYKIENAHFIFSTAKGELNFNKSLEEGRNNIEKIKEWFGVEDVGFLNQIHSDKVFIYDKNMSSGDGIITNKKNVAIGIFTADCVPVLLFDKKNEVIAAVHSGWKGTLSCITAKAVDLMINEYSSESENIFAYIGPHIGECCYEVGKEVQDKFNEFKLYDNLEIIKNNKLDLEKCIIKQLTNKGVNIDNIHSISSCTFCGDDYKLYSYRKSNGTDGRMFSFVFLK